MPPKIFALELAVENARGKNPIRSAAFTCKGDHANGNRLRGSWTCRTGCFAVFDPLTDDNFGLSHKISLVFAAQRNIQILDSGISVPSRHVSIVIEQHSKIP